MEIVLTALNGSNTTLFNSGFGQFVVDHTILWRWLQDYGRTFLDWLTQPNVLAVITAWWITFTVVLILLSCVGFNPIGIGAGTIAAWFQSWMYGGFTPAGGVFATLTSLAMLGCLVPLQAGAAAILATAVAVIVWMFQ